MPCRGKLQQDAATLRLIAVTLDQTHGGRQQDGEQVPNSSLFSVSPGDGADQVVGATQGGQPLRQVAGHLRRRRVRHFAYSASCFTCINFRVK